MEVRRENDEGKVLAWNCLTVLVLVKVDPYALDGAMRADCAVRPGAPASAREYTTTASILERTLPR